MGCAIIRDYIRIKAGSHLTSTKFNGVMLKMARESRGLDLEKFAKSIGLRVDSLREIELGIRFPTEYELCRFSEYLDFPEAFFYCETYKVDAPEIIHICGDGIRACHNCGEVADYLCDYPVGEGKTCDLPLCRKCRTHVGKYDFCPIHGEQNKVIKLLDN